MRLESTELPRLSLVHRQTIDDPAGWKRPPRDQTYIAHGEPGQVGSSVIGALQARFAPTDGGEGSVCRTLTDRRGQSGMNRYVTEHDPDVATTTPSRDTRR